MDFKRLNMLGSWLSFLIALIVYSLTVEPTTSFWDCGEFIASAYKLEVGHPPGAPVFMLLGRLFSLFAFGDVGRVALMVNMLSVVASAFTIFFLFQTISYLAKQLIIKLTEAKSELGDAQHIAILGSSFVGALAYTFSDSFWFSAVEGEVYALSSLFTAAVFWAGIKWHQEADSPRSWRWIVLIAYLMGLSIGVHLLNLLTIPALAMLFYFRKYQITLKGSILALLIGVAILGLIQYGIIQGVVSLAAKFELLFVNALDLPFWSGALFYFALMAVVLIVGIYYTHRTQKPVLNLILVSFTVIMIGYSSFTLIVIRSMANPPMDENNPEQLFSLLSYLNREQYGNRPLVYGESYNAPIVDQKPKYTYYPIDEHYKKIEQPGPEYIYDSEYKSIFPRMYSRQGSHVQGYRNWSRTKTTNKEPPTFGDNLTYFMRYQVGFMYFRYFMWNFSGRQNDVQGHGGYSNGNWISGFRLMDSVRLGPQDILPDWEKNAPTRNAYFLLPLILGLMGFLYYWQNSPREALIITILFVMTGLAIVVYVNQPPYQPRERDYSYVGSFYAFAIFIGMGVIALYDMLSLRLSHKISAIVVSLFSLILIPGIMLAQNYDDHDRSGRYAVRDLAKNYLNSCAPNAILFTFGDNDTFPLWYAQEVEGVRTDVRVVNLSLLSTDWYIDQMKRKAYESEPVPFSLEFEHYIMGTRDFVPVYENPAALLSQKTPDQTQLSQADYDTLYNRLLQILENSDFPTKNPGDFQILSGGSQSLSVMQFAALVEGLTEDKLVAHYAYSGEKIAALNLATVELKDKIAEKPTDLSLVMDFVKSNDASTRVEMRSGDMLDYIPTRKFKIDVDSATVMQNHILKPHEAGQMLSEIEWTMPKDYITKNELMVLDLIAHNNWQRPVYFAVSVDNENHLGLSPYLRLEGFAYRLVPVKTQRSPSEIQGYVDSDLLYKRLMEEFNWGRMYEPDFHIDEHHVRTINLINIRGIFSRLATQLNAENKADSAISVVDRCLHILPNDKLPFDFYTIGLLDAYYKAGAKERAQALSAQIQENYHQKLSYYLNLPGRFQSNIDYEDLIAIYNLINTITEYEGTFADQLLLTQSIALMETTLPFVAEFRDMEQIGIETLSETYQKLSENNKRYLSLYMKFIDLLQNTNPIQP